MKHFFFLAIFFGLVSTGFCQTDFNLTYKNGLQHHQDKNYQFAIVCYDSIILGCHNASLVKMSYIFKSQCLRYEGDMEQSLKCINKAIELDPSDIASYFDRIHILEDLDKYEDVIKECKFILKKSPSKTQEAYCHFYTGKAYTFLNEFEKSLNFYDKSLKLIDTDYQTYYYRGFTYENLNKIQLAIDDYTKAIELKDNFTQGYE